MYISINDFFSLLLLSSSALRWLPTAGRRRRKHELHQLERRRLGGDADASAAQEKTAEEPHVFYAGANRGAGKRSKISANYFVKLVSYEIIAADMFVVTM